MTKRTDYLGTTLGLGALAAGSAVAIAGFKCLVLGIYVGVMAPRNELPWGAAYAIVGSVLICLSIYCGRYGYWKTRSALLRNFSFDAKSFLRAFFKVLVLELVVVGVVLALGEQSKSLGLMLVIVVIPILFGVNSASGFIGVYIGLLVVPALLISLWKAISKKANCREHREA